MKTINEYLLSKNKSKVDDLLNKNYKDIYELVDDLNIYLEDRLKKPIKVVKTETKFRPMSPYNNDGIIVQEHFMIEFNDTSSRVRFGNFGGDLMMQSIFRDWKGKPDYGTITRYRPYKYGTNFLEWLIGLKDKWTYVIEMFKLDEMK